MAINLTKIFGKINDIKKGIFYGNDPSTQQPYTLKIYHVNTLTAELESGWYISTATSSDFIEAKEVFELSVSNVYSNIDINEILTKATKVEFKNVTFKVESYVKPLAATENWVLQITPIVNK